LSDHLEPLQRWRIVQLSWFMRLRTWKRSLYTLFILPFFGFVVLAFRIFAFSFQMMYAGIFFSALMIIEYMIGNLDEKVSTNAQSQTDVTVTDQDELESKTLFESGANSLSQIAHLLQEPLICRLRRNIEALSAPTAQPRATFFYMARMWLKVCIFISLCDAALDKWYLKNSMLLQERMAAVDAQEVESKRTKVTDYELQNKNSKDMIMSSSPEIHHQHLVFQDPRQPLSDEPSLCSPQISSQSTPDSASAVDVVDSNMIFDRILPKSDVAPALPYGAHPCPPPSGFNVQNFEVAETSANATGFAEVSSKIIAKKLRLRRPREPWTLLWGNLHISKTQQVTYLCDRVIVII
jgi:hypothetical protein